MGALVMRNFYTGVPLSLNLQDFSNQTVAAICEFAKQELAHTDPEKFGSTNLDFDGSCWGVRTTMSINISTAEVFGNGGNSNDAFSVAGKSIPNGFELRVKNAHGVFPLNLKWSSGHRMYASNANDTSNGQFEVRGATNDIVI